MPVAEARARISQREFWAWVAFAQTEPWGETAENIRAAVIAAYAGGAFGRRIDPARVYRTHFEYHERGRRWITDPRAVVSILSALVRRRG